MAWINPAISSHANKAYQSVCREQAGQGRHACPGPLSPGAGVQQGDTESSSSNPVHGSCYTLAAELLKDGHSGGPPLNPGRVQGSQEGLRGTVPKNPDSWWGVARSWSGQDCTPVSRAGCVPLGTGSWMSSAVLFGLETHRGLCLVPLHELQEHL